MNNSKLKITVKEKIEFDFDHWAMLWKSDPKKFEAERIALMENMIASAPATQQRRLRGIMFEVNAIRSASACPLKSCIRISKLMWKSFDKMRLVICEGMEGSPQQHTGSDADILLFHQKKGQNTNS